MSKVLLDTSVIVDFLRLNDKADTLSYKLSVKKYSLLISIITHTELYAGKSVWEHSDAKRELETIFENLTVIPLTVGISTRAGRLRALNGLSTIDAIIAATALEKNVPLVTLNVKDFKGAPTLRLHR